MKNKLIRTMHMVLVISVLSVTIGVYSIVSVLFYHSKIAEMRERAYGVKDYVMEVLSAEDFDNINQNTEAGAMARQRIQEKLSPLQGVGSMKQLYVAAIDEAGRLVTTVDYIPSGEPEADLRRSLNEGVAVSGNWFYQSETGRVFTIYWPVLASAGGSMSAVCMEFDADSTYESFRLTAIYSLALSGALTVVFSIFAYLSLNRASEPFYKKLAYTDFLTGLQNRMAYEQRLVSCEAVIPKGMSVTLIMFDVNNLKTVNDTLGHTAGDNYIVNTTKVITELLGSLGELYRIGGDEFAAIVVDRKQEDIEKALDALRKEDRAVLNKNLFSCACGAATFTPGTDKNLRDLAGRADEEMYAEKRRKKERMKGGRRKEE